MCVCVCMLLSGIHTVDNWFLTPSQPGWLYQGKHTHFSALSFCFAERSALYNLCKSYPLFVIVTYFQFVEAGCLNGSGEEEVSFISAVKLGPVWPMEDHTYFMT